MCYAPPGRTSCGRSGNCQEGVCLPGPLECDSPEPCNISFCAPNGQTCYGNTYPSGEMMEVLDLRFASDKATLTWTRRADLEPDECPAARFGIVWGPLSTLPVGSLPASETCNSLTAYTFYAPQLVPAAGSGVWFLVRAHVYHYLGGPPQDRWGPLGFAGSHGVPTTERGTDACY
jgi:hypothetical protein